VTAFPHHPLGVIPAEYRGKFVTEETYEGIRVIRCWLWALPNRPDVAAHALPDLLRRLRGPLRPAAARAARRGDRQLALSSRSRRLGLCPFAARRSSSRSGTSGRPSSSRPRSCRKDGSTGSSRGGRWPSTAPPNRIVVVTKSFRQDLLESGSPRGKSRRRLQRRRRRLSTPRAFRRRPAGSWRGTPTSSWTYAGPTASSRARAGPGRREAFRDDPRVAFAFVGEGARKDALSKKRSAAVSPASHFTRRSRRSAFPKSIRRPTSWSSAFGRSDLSKVRPVEGLRSARGRPPPRRRAFGRSGRDRPRRRGLVAERAMAGQSRQRSGSFLSDPARAKPWAPGRRYVRETTTARPWRGTT